MMRTDIKKKHTWEKNGLTVSCNQPETILTQTVGKWSMVWMEF